MTHRDGILIDLVHEMAPPPEGLVNRVVYLDDRIKAVASAFAAGATVAEHSSQKTALLCFVSGQATVMFGEATNETQAGTWIRIPPNLKHSISAVSVTIMLLVMLS